MWTEHIALSYVPRCPWRSHVFFLLFGFCAFDLTNREQNFQHRLGVVQVFHDVSICVEPEQLRLLCGWHVLDLIDVGEERVIA